jgi:hypothetical protein
VGIPELPPGTTLDLTHPTIRLDGVGVPEFTIPNILSVPGGASAVIAPHSLTTGDWIVIARNNNLLRAYTLGDPRNEGDDPPTADELALDYVVPESAAFFVDKHLISEVRHEVTYSSTTASYVRAGFDKQSASLSIPYVAASFEREHKEKEAQASSRKTIYMFGSWYYPRALLSLKKFSKASTRLTEAIEAAVDANDADDLKQVFDKYGWAAPEAVEIGGQLFLTHTEVVGASVVETEVKDTIGAAVTAKFDGVDASVGIGFGNASGTKVTADQLSKSTSFRAKGGVATLASNPQQWPDTVNNPNNWAVISVSKLVPITHWLEPALRAKVERLLPEMGRAALQLPQGISDQNHSARADSDGFIFGMRYEQGDLLAQGGLELVCGPSGSPALGQSDAVGASATFHVSHGYDVWLDSASICLPVRKGSHYSVKKWDDYRGDRARPGGAPTRFTKTETKLTFGKWQTLSDKKVLNCANVQIVQFAPGTQKSDGFIFCSIRASDLQRGSISCTVDGKLVGAASVHDQYPDKGCWSPYACFCVAVPRDLPMSVDVSGTVDLKAWYLPITSQDWKFGSAERYTLNALYKAETDGFLHGVVTVRQGAARGQLFLYYGQDQKNLTGTQLHPFFLPPAVIAVHQTGNRFIPYASAMLPIRRGYYFRADTYAGLLSGSPTVEAYWTPLLPVA